MQTVKIIALTMVIMASMVYAQPPEILWTRRFDSGTVDACYGVRQTRDSGYILTGCGWYSLLKTDSSGQELWHKSSGMRTIGNTVASTSDEGYIIGGDISYQVGGQYDYWLCKTNELGDTVWTHKYGGDNWDECYAVCETDDGGYLLAGRTGSSFLGADTPDIWIVRTDANGDSLWSRRFGSESYDGCYSATPTSDGGYILAGYQSQSLEVDSSYGELIRISARGDSLWGHAYSQNRQNKFCYAYETQEGGYVAAGSTVLDLTGSSLFWLMKTDSEGLELWSRALDELDRGTCYSAHETSDGGTVLVGSGLCQQGSTPKALVIKIDRDGNLLWCREAEDGATVGRCIEQTSDGGYIVGGSISTNGSSSQDYWLMKLAPETPPSASSVPDITTNNFALSQNYPNPFNLTTKISFTLPHMDNIRLNVYDIAGREVQRFVDGFCIPGDHTIEINGEGLTSGIYFVRLQSESLVQTRKIILLK